MAIESGLPSRYEIRVLEEKHIDWAAAIVAQATSSIHPCGQSFTHNTRQNMCIFDKEYRFKRDESLPSEGKLYWDVADENANGAKLLDQMDFPLVSVALAYDSFDHLDMGKMAELMAILPAFGPSYAVLAKNDTRDPTSWEAKGHGEVIFRNATSTRHDYEGKGLMRKLANYMMRDAAKKGWRGIQIESMNDAVAHVWGNPPAPFRGEEVSDFHMWTYEEENENGEIVFPFRPAKQRVVKLFCYLTEES